MIEWDRTIYLEDDTSTSQGLREIVFKEHQVFIPMPIASAPISSPIIDQHPVATIDDESIENVDPVAPDFSHGYTLEEVRGAPRRPAISDDYIVYLQEHEYDVGDVLDPTTYKEAIVSPQSNFWIDAMKDEITSMS